MEFEKLKQIVAEILSVDPRELTEETNFIDDLCADSLDLYQVIQEIEETFEIAIPEEEAEKIKTVGEAVEADQKDKERVNNMTEEYTIGELEKKIGYQFRDKSLLKQALTHSSFANEQRINKLKDYERLEFLGDAVLELISSDFLFHENPQMPEGKLDEAAFLDGL